VGWGADWSVTDTYSLAVFSKVRSFPFFIFSRKKLAPSRRSSRSIFSLSLFSLFFSTSLLPKQNQSAIRAAMRTDDSFYQETYINANVNGVRPYWKNVKVRKRERERRVLRNSGFLFSFLLRRKKLSLSPLESRISKPKLSASPPPQLYFEYTYQPFGLKIPQAAIDVIANNTFTVRERREREKEEEKKKTETKTKLTS